MNCVLCFSWWFHKNNWALMIRFVISPSLRSSNIEFHPHLSRAQTFKSAVLFLRHAKYSLYIVVQRQVYTWKLCLVNSHLQQRQHKWHTVCMQADVFIFKNVFLCIVWHLCHGSLHFKIKKLKGKSKHGTWVMESDIQLQRVPKISISEDNCSI